VGTTPTRLIDIATTVADLTPIDWVALEAEATGPAERAALKRLRLLERLVHACADIVQPDRSGPTTEAHADRDTLPRTWGPFTIHERVGRGTFGDVYRAHDRRLDRIVALKLLRPGREGADALESEAIYEGRLLAKVRHPNVVTVHGAERIDGRVGVWMGFIDGRTLAEEVRASGPLAPDAVVAIGLTLCGALAAVHDAGLLHRDLKAQNVMRAADGRILLTDFGTGRVVAGQPDDGAAELAGTPLYLAPELLTGQPASIASELYSFGVLLYHLATGSFPVRGRTLRELRDAHNTGARVSVRAYRHKLPRALMAVIDRATEPNPANRFASLQALRDALARCRKSGVRTMAWIVVPVTVALLAIAALNLIWSMSPPPVLTSHTAVAMGHPVPGTTLLSTKADRLYFHHQGKTYSMIPGRPKSEATLSDGTSPFWLVDISPDREEYLAVRKDSRELWLIPQSGRNRPVGDARCDQAALSPKGHRIACVFGSAFSVVTTDGASSTALPTPPQGQVANPRWSPQSDALRFEVAVTSRGPNHQPHLGGPRGRDEPPRLAAWMG
jgi:serine/threonine protein kinase